MTWRFRNRKGYTLVEIMVSFALTGLLFASVGVLLPQCIRRHGQMKALADAAAVSEIILSQITGEVAGARDTGYGKDELTLEDLGSTGYPSLVLTDQNHNQVEITRTEEEEGAYLVFCYQPSEKHPRERLWGFDPALYQGFVIRSLEFEQMEAGEGFHADIVKVSLTLEQKKTGFRYTESRCALYDHFTEPILLRGQ